jgi:hypothetical protein
MRLLDQQYLTPFMAVETDFWQKLGYKVNRKQVKRLMKISWQTIYKEPRTTMSKRTYEIFLFTQRFENYPKKGGLLLT